MCNSQHGLHFRLSLSKFSISDFIFFFKQTDIRNNTFFKKNECTARFCFRILKKKGTAITVQKSGSHLLVKSLFINLLHHNLLMRTLRQVNNSPAR